MGPRNAGLFGRSLRQGYCSAARTLAPRGENSSQAATRRRRHTAGRRRRRRRHEEAVGPCLVGKFITASELNSRRRHSLAQLATGWPPVRQLPPVGNESCLPAASVGGGCLTCLLPPAARAFAA